MALIFSGSNVWLFLPGSLRVSERLAASHPAVHHVEQKE